MTPRTGEKRGEKQLDCHSLIIFLEFVIFLLKSEKKKKKKNRKKADGWKMRINMGINVWHFQFLLPESPQALLRNPTPRAMAPLQQAAPQGAPQPAPNRHRHSHTVPYWTASGKCSRLPGCDRSPAHKRKWDSTGVNPTVTMWLKRQASKQSLPGKACIWHGTTGSCS